MADTAGDFELIENPDGELALTLSGTAAGAGNDALLHRVKAGLSQPSVTALTVNLADAGLPDSATMALLLRCYTAANEAGKGFDDTSLPQSARQLLRVATTVKPHRPEPDPPRTLRDRLDPTPLLAEIGDGLREFLAFIGDVSRAMGRLLTGRANTRWTDFTQFCYQAGPDAFAIISLTSILVGMILAYLGAVQLQQFGAEIYVADLVVIGMLREMGALMTAVVMAGRTGAAYAAQLGTMQTNEEIDAIITMGVSPMEFLVLPRMLALVVIMPLLTLYANLLGIVGGGIVAGGMGIQPLQYANAGGAVLSYSHVVVGLIKSVVFAALIAIAGCRSGINSGRSSAAVGEAATEAVVAAIVYLIIADALINILCQQFGF